MAINLKRQQFQTVATIQIIRLAITSFPKFFQSHSGCPLAQRTASTYPGNRINKSRSHSWCNLTISRICRFCIGAIECTLQRRSNVFSSFLICAACTPPHKPKRLHAGIISSPLIRNIEYIICHFCSNWACSELALSLLWARKASKIFSHMESISVAKCRTRVQSDGLSLTFWSSETQANPSESK